MSVIVKNRLLEIRLNLFISSLLFAIIVLDLSIAYFIGCAMHLIKRKYIGRNLLKQMVSQKN